MREIIEIIILAIILIVGCNKIFETICNVMKRSIEAIKKKREENDKSN